MGIVSSASEGLFAALLLEAGFLHPAGARSDVVSRFEEGEWGSPEQLARLDPLLNLPSVRHCLPAMLLTAARHDARVSSADVEAFAAAMALHHPDVVCRVQHTAGGHGGDGGAISWADEAAEQIDFLLAHTE